MRPKSKVELCEAIHRARARAGGICRAGETVMTTPW
jgi:hypothetical protein